MDYPSNPEVGLVDGKFSDGNPSLGIPASLDPATHLNAITDEILHVIVQAGLEPDEESTTQLYEAIKMLAGGSIPIGGTIMVPYSVTPDGDSTNTSVLASYPEGFIKPQGQILSSAEYPELKARLGAGRVFDLLSSTISLVSFTASTGAGIYDDDIMFISAPGSGSFSVVTWICKISTSQLNDIRLSNAKQSGDVGNSSVWVTPSEAIAHQHLYWRNDGTTGSTINPQVGTLASVFDDTFPLAGTISVTHHYARIGHFCLNNTIYSVVNYLAAANSDYQKGCWKSTNNGGSWVAASWSPAADKIQMVYGGRHDESDNTAILIASNGDIDTSYALSGGSGTNGRVSVAQISDGAVTDVEFVYTHTSGLEGAGDNYIVGDTVTFGAGGKTVTCRVDVVQTGGRITALTVLDGGSGWVGSVGIFTTNSEGVFTLRQAFDGFDKRPSLRRFDATCEWTIRKVEGVWYCGTKSRLYRSVDRITWAPVAIPALSVPSRFSRAPDGGLMMPRSDAVSYSQGFWSADGATWVDDDSWSYTTNVVAANVRYTVGEGTKNYVHIVSGASGYLSQFDDLLDYATEFQIPRVVDPGATGMGAGLYPLMRIK